MNGAMVFLAHCSAMKKDFQFVSSKMEVPFRPLRRIFSILDELLSSMIILVVIPQKIIMYLN